MGVTGLWSIVQPCARPTKIETLNRKRLAVDASIWIYQFLKAVRDKEGNALRNSHIVGFFRRICKLLFFGIKPIFVFDGGAPALKRSVIQQRKRRREGRRDDAVRTAGKLLAVQMQRHAEEEEQRRKDEARHPRQQVEEEVPEEGLVYVDEMFSTAQEKNQNRSKFRKKDAYHLPELDMAMAEMGGPNDPRVMSLEELQNYARQFDSGEDVNVYDFSKIDYDSPFFTSLPASDRYNILNAARLRSRLRMGHSKEQLDTMFPDRMAFSKFQIERVTERNELTQRLMHVHEGGEGAFDGMGRVAGEKGREYVLVKNDGVEGGWALGVVSNEGRSMKDAIDLDKPLPTIKDESSSDEDGDFEDIAIEGLNRLPKLPAADQPAPKTYNRQRQALYRNRRKAAKRKPKPVNRQESDSLFVAEEDPTEELSSDEDAELFGGEEDDADDEEVELRKAIEMSMQNDHDEGSAEEETMPASEESEHEGDRLAVFQQSAVSDALPVPKGSGRAIANIVNKRAFNAAPESHETTSFGVPVPRHDNEHEGDNSMDLQAALAESRRTKRRRTPPGPRFSNVQPQTPKSARRQTSTTPRKPALRAEESASEIAKAHGFSGPLPFEKLDLGSSLLGKKKMQERQAQVAGGFDNSIKDDKTSGPLPPWFSGNLEKDLAKQKEVEEEDRQRQKDFERQYQFEKANAPLRRYDTGDVIDLDPDEPVPSQKQIIAIDEDDEPAQASSNGVSQPDVQSEVPIDGLMPPDGGVEPDTSTMPDAGDLAEDVRAEPPTPGLPDERQPVHDDSEAPLPIEDAIPVVPSEAASTEGFQQRLETLQNSSPQPTPRPVFGEDDDDDEKLDWSASEDERDARPRAAQSMAPVEQISPQPAEVVRSRSPSVEFEDVSIPDRPAKPTRQPPAPLQPPPVLTMQESVPDEEAFDDFSDPEDEELLRSLAQEAEEHARFESTLNQKTVAQNIADYEKELKQLRNQQKKDRRDADEVTHIMITECQQLLRLFGLPFITAPMEAEAQCAELVRLGLVDGIVTDDSDCFLFGGTRVYKNVFNQAKFVECYLSTDLQKEFDLTREKMISVAQLLGSDYTEGLNGVGPVSALEIIAEFGDLVAFKQWWTGVQDLSITKADDSGNVFRRKFRKNASKLFLPPAFPDERVIMAYMQPEVDSSDQPFMWGVPDLEALRTFLMATIGWSQERTDEVLVPVIRDMNRRADEGTQANITAFFDGSIGAGAAGRGQGGEAFAPRRRIDTSKRMGRAMGLLANQAQKEKDTANGRNATADEGHSDESDDTLSSNARTKKRVAAESENTGPNGAEIAPPTAQKKRRKR